MEWQPLILIDCLLNEAMEVPDGQYALAVLNGQYAISKRAASRVGSVEAMVINPVPFV